MYGVWQLEFRLTAIGRYCTYTARQLSLICLRYRCSSAVCTLAYLSWSLKKKVDEDEPNLTLRGVQVVTKKGAATGVQHPHWWFTALSSPLARPCCRPATCGRVRRVLALTQRRERGTLGPSETTPAPYGDGNIWWV